MHQSQKQSTRSAETPAKTVAPPVAPALLLGFFWPCFVLGAREGSAIAPMASAAATEPPPPVAVPVFWDPRRRPERPDLSRLQSIRFLTDLDYPPFDYAGPDGNPT